MCHIPVKPIGGWGERKNRDRIIKSWLKKEGGYSRAAAHYIPLCLQAAE